MERFDVEHNTNSRKDRLYKNVLFGQKNGRDASIAEQGNVIIQSENKGNNQERLITEKMSHTDSFYTFFFF